MSERRIIVKLEKQSSRSDVSRAFAEISGFAFVLNIQLKHSSNVSPKSDNGKAKVHL